MKSIGIVRRIDELGRIVIPMETRRSLGIKEDDGLEIFTEGENVILRKYAPGCVLCGSVEDGLINFKGKLICNECVDGIKK